MYDGAFCGKFCEGVFVPQRRSIASRQVTKTPSQNLPQNPHHTCVYLIHPHFRNQDYSKQSHLQSQALTSQEHYTFVKLEFKGKFTFVSSPAPLQEQSISKSLQIYNYAAAVAEKEKDKDLNV